MDAIDRHTHTHAARVNSILIYHSIKFNSNLPFVSCLLCFIFIFNFHYRSFGFPYQHLFWVMLTNCIHWLVDMNKINHSFFIYVIHKNRSTSLCILICHFKLSFIHSFIRLFCVSISFNMICVCVSLSSCSMLCVCDYLVFYTQGEDQ